MKREGQAWGFDLVVGVMIFLFGIFAFYLYTTNIQSGDGGILGNLKKNGQLVADSLMSEGSPSDWESSNVIRIGLISNKKIDQNKVNNFSSMDYATTKKLFKINNEYFVFFGDDLDNGIGLRPNNEKNLVKITRVVIYNNKITTLNVYSWN